MSLLLSAALSFLPTIWPLHAPQAVTREYTLPVWQFSMTKDRFAGTIRCQVYQGGKAHPKVSYLHHALVFHFQKRINTFDAIYRLDGGSPKRWQDLYPKVIDAGVTLDGDSLANPTGGLVIMPLSEVASVHTVTIRPTPTAKPHTFIIDGYSDAIDAARARGCQPDAAFVR